jgi:hypothetical protein
MSKEAVNHPDHYQSGSGIEVIDVIEAFNLGFNLGNVVKYILRAGHKGDRREDLKKAMWYLSREIGTDPGKEIRTNADLYKNYLARGKAWTEYCESRDCSTCPINGEGCAFHWLELPPLEREVAAYIARTISSKKPQ